MPDKACFSNLHGWRGVAHLWEKISERPYSVTPDRLIPAPKICRLFFYPANGFTIMPDKIGISFVLVGSPTNNRMIIIRMNDRPFACLSLNAEEQHTFAVLFWKEIL